MPRLAHVLIAAVLAVGLAFGFGATLAQSQTEPPAATSPVKAKKALTEEEKAERKAAKQKARQEKAAAKKAKAEQCRAEGKQNALKGKDLRGFVKKCVAS